MKGNIYGGNPLNVGEKMNEVKIEDYTIKNFSTPFVIAEIGANHNGDIEIAKKLIKLAKKAGASAVKFQSWNKNSLFSKIVYENDKELEKELDEWSLSYDDLLVLKELCDECDILFGCTPSTIEDIDFLANEVDTSYIKIASGDIDNKPLIETAAKTGKPVIIAEGMATLDELYSAAEIFEKNSNKNLIILHAVSLYPPDDSNINLMTIDLLRDLFNYPVGYSDHTLGISIPLAAVARGAAVIEKHFTLDKRMYGWDHRVSADFNDLKILVNESRRISKSLGRYTRKISNEELEKRKIMRRSLVAKNKITKGQVLKKDDLSFKRPGTGLEISCLDIIIGSRAKRDIEADELILFKDIDFQ